MTRSLVAVRSPNPPQAQPVEFWRFIIPYTGVAIALLFLSVQLAVMLGAGRSLVMGWTDVRGSALNGVALNGVMLNGYGGLLVGAVQGGLQYAVLRSRYRVSAWWIGVTAIAWAVGVMGGAHREGCGLWDVLDLPLFLGGVGLMQCLGVVRQRRLRVGWLKVVGMQMGVALLGQVLVMGLLLVLALGAIAGLSGGWLIWGVAIAVSYGGVVLVHGVIPAVGLYGLCREGGQFA
jgi:hypothetical protein